MAQSVGPREAGRRVAARLREAGFQAFFAGGCVRDRLLGLEPEDYDVATDATPEEVQRLFPNAHGVGEAFGVMLVRRDRHCFEVATFRTDAAYVDGRRPSSVRFASAREDAERRDFTINGLFEDPETGEVVDFVDGRADLAARLLRAIGEPRRRFEEDHLRLLRAVRFAARFRLAIEPGTAEAMRVAAPRLALVARERVGMELRRMLADPSRAAARDLLERFQFDGVVLDEEPRRSGGDRLGMLEPGAGFPLALTAWELDRAGPGAEADLDGRTIDRRRAALCLSNEETDALRDLASCRRGLREFPALAESARKRLAARPGFRGALRLAAQDAPPLAAEAEAWLAALDPASIAPPRLVDGRDLLRLGLLAGPRFRELLDAVYDAQLEGRVGTREEGVRYVEELLSRGA